MSNSAPLLVVEGLGHAYGERTIFTDVEFTVGAGEFVCIVGPSGVGKSTALNCISGLLRPTQGSLTFLDERVEGPPRNLAVVFQDYSRSLMPWMTASRNIELPLRSDGVSKSDREERIARALSEVGLEGAGDLYPWQMSGGMQQRVAIARALACQPKLIIMDEPFASVDAQTREDLEDLMLRVRDRSGIAFIQVTHDIDEAIYLSNRVIVLAGSPATLADVIEVDLGAGRDQLGTKALPLFGELRTRVHKYIKATRQV